MTLRLLSKMKLQLKELLESPLYKNTCLHTEALGIYVVISVAPCFKYKYRLSGGIKSLRLQVQER